MMKARASILAWFLKNFLSKYMKKSRKNENYRKTFGQVINNHIFVPETRGQVIWSDTHHSIREKSVWTINLLWAKSAYQETYYGWISMIFGQKTNDLSWFFCLLEYFASPQNHEYLLDFNFERRKSHLLLESCRCSASNTTFFHLKK